LALLTLAFVDQLPSLGDLSSLRFQRCRGVSTVLKRYWELEDGCLARSESSRSIVSALTPPSSSTGLRVKETKEVYEGEVTELTPAETENPLSGYGKTISHVVVALKTVKGTKQLRLDPSIYESIQKERVTIGDVIYIEANTGAVKVGSSLPLAPSS
jgi:hypothetical protein